MKLRELVLHPAHDPVSNLFLGKMMDPEFLERFMPPMEEPPPPAVMIRGTMDQTEFTLSSLWNENGMELMGTAPCDGKAETFLSDLTPQLRINPYGGYAGAAKEMRVRATMNVDEAGATTRLQGTHAHEVVEDSREGQKEKVSSSFNEGPKPVLETSFGFFRERALFGEGLKANPKSGEVLLKASRGGEKAYTAQPLTFSLLPDQSWKISGQVLVERPKPGTGEKETVAEPVERIYRFLKMPFIGIPYVEVDSKFGDSEAHYTLAPIPGLILLARVVKQIRSRIEGKEVFIPPYQALEEAKKLPKVGLVDLRGLLAQRLIGRRF